MFIWPAIPFTGKKITLRSLGEFYFQHINRKHGRSTVADGLSCHPYSSSPWGVIAHFLKDSSVLPIKLSQGNSSLFYFKTGPCNNGDTDCEYEEALCCSSPFELTCLPPPCQLSFQRHLLVTIGSMSALLGHHKRGHPGC